MKRLFLASSIDRSAKGISKFIPHFQKLKLVFINTASEPEKGDKGWLDLDRQGLVDAGFNVSDYSVTGKTINDIEKDLNKFDIIRVNGGNTFYLLLQSRKSGFDKWIKKAVEKGKIYIGSSAGSIIASPDIKIVKSLALDLFIDELKTLEGYGLVDFIALTHWGSEDFRSAYMNDRMENAYKPENKIILLNDNQYIRVENDMYKIEVIEK